MAATDHRDAHDEAVTAGDDGEPVESHGPESEVEIIVRRASPARLVLRVAIALVLLGGAALGGWRVWSWWAAHAAPGGR
jgi:hypothetical protein